MMLQNLVAARTPPYFGCELAYWRCGSGPRVVFIQGTGLHGDGWLPQVRSLSEDHTCLWFDNRGIGSSCPRGGAAISVEQMAQDALAVMDAAQWPNAHVVGHSLGGCIALELALAQPDRVRSLALLCTSADGPGLVRMDWPTIWRGIRMQIGTLRSRRRAFLEIVLTKPEHQTGDLDHIARSLEPLFGHDLGVTPAIAMRQVRAMSRWNVLARLADLKSIPTLVVGATHDLIARRELVRATAAAIPGAKLVELEGAAHGVPVTAPDTVTHLLRDHLGEVEARMAGRRVH